jgi:hypothetical protein
VGKKNFKINLDEELKPDLAYVLEHINKVSQAQADAIFNPEKAPIDPAKIDPFDISEIYKTLMEKPKEEPKKATEEPEFDLAAIIEQAQKEAWEMAKKIYKDEF